MRQWGENHWIKNPCEEAAGAISKRRQREARVDVNEEEDKGGRGGEPT